MENSQNNLKLFENKKIRYVWNAEEEEWYFSVIDVVEVLTESDRPRKYWNDLKKKLETEGSQLSDKIGQLKLPASDGKLYKTDVLSTRNVLRLIQSIPSPKAEPFKMWLAEVGNEVLNESVDPELSIERAIQNYRKLGYKEDWINQRIKAIEVRKALTDEWDKAGVKQGKEYAILTDLMYKTWAGLSAKEYKEYKGLQKENLRDNMTNLELILNMLAEASATELSQNDNPEGLSESAKVAVSGAEVARDARSSLEKRGAKVISSKNAKDLGIKQIPENTDNHKDDK